MTSYYDQPYAASAQYNSAPFGAPQHYDAAYEQMRAAAWQQFYAQQAAGAPSQTHQYQPPAAQFQPQQFQPQQFQQQQFQPPPQQYQQRMSSSVPPPPPPPPVSLQSANRVAPPQTQPTLSWADRFKQAQQKKSQPDVSRPPTLQTSHNYIPLSSPPQKVTTLPPQRAALPSPGGGRGRQDNRPAWMTEGTATASSGPSPAKKSRWDSSTPVVQSKSQSQPIAKMSIAA